MFTPFETRLQTNDRAEKLRSWIDRVKTSTKTRVNLYKLAEQKKGRGKNRSNKLASESTNTMKYRLLLIRDQGRSNRLRFSQCIV